jgi:glycosyltransferase involved in cell wall biosynthesis
MRPTGLREIANITVKVLSAIYERRIYRKARRVIVPSDGLSRELISVYGVDPARITVVAPPVNSAFHESDDSERHNARRQLGLSDTDTALLLVSAGDFGRKGLAPLLEAMADPSLAQVKLIVVGGLPGPRYSRLVRAMKLQDRVSFCGRHKSIEGFFWAADAFILPSRYEVFPAVTIEAACSGLPLITTHLNGVEEYAVDGITGFTIKECAAQAITDAIRQFLLLPHESRLEMGRNAHNAVRGYGMDRFVNSWNCVYSQSVSAGNRDAISGSETHWANRNPGAAPTNSKGYPATRG